MEDGADGGEVVMRPPELEVLDGRNAHPEFADDALLRRLRATTIDSGRPRFPRLGTSLSGGK
jgi:hypothetical protein